MPAPALGQVPAAVQVDLLNARLAQEIEREDFKAVLGTLAELRKLDPNLSKDMMFVEAMALSRTGRSAEAKVLLERYFKDVGQGGKYYQQALALYNTADRQAKAEADRAAAEKAKREREAAARRAAAAKAEEDRKKREAADKARREAEEFERRVAAEFGRHAIMIEAHDPYAQSAFAPMPDGGIVFMYATGYSGQGVNATVVWHVRRIDGAGRTLWRRDLPKVRRIQFSQPRIATTPSGDIWAIYRGSGDYTASPLLLHIGPDGKDHQPPSLRKFDNLWSMAGAPDGGFYASFETSNGLALLRFGAHGQQLWSRALFGGDRRVKRPWIAVNGQGAVAVAACRTIVSGSNVANTMMLSVVDAAGREAMTAAHDGRCPTWDKDLQHGVLWRDKALVPHIAAVTVKSGRACCEFDTFSIADGQISSSRIMFGHSMVSAAITGTNRQALIASHQPDWGETPRGIGNFLAAGGPVKTTRLGGQILWPKILAPGKRGELLVAGVHTPVGLRGQSVTSVQGTQKIFIVRLDPSQMPVAFGSGTGVAAPAPAPAAAAPAAPVPAANRAAPAAGPPGAAAELGAGAAIGSVQTARPQFKVAFVRLIGAKPAPGAKLYALGTNGAKISLRMHERQGAPGTIVVTADDMSGVAAGATVFAE